MAILSCVFIFTVGAAAQGRPGVPPGGPPQAGGGGLGRGVGLPTDMNEKGSIVVRVLGPQNMTLRQQAFVRLYSINSGVLLSGGMTNLDGSISFNNLPSAGYYTVEVSAAGYQTQRKTFEVTDTSMTFAEVDVTMQSASGESAATYTAASNLPGKARRHIDKGILAFRAANYKRAQKELTDAYNVAPKSGVTNYLLGVLYLQMKDLQQSERYFTNAVTIEPKDVPALIGLGHLRYQKGDLKGSADTLQKAIAIDPKQWEALWLLAEIDLRQRNFQKAQKEAESAVELGKGAANGAEFIEAVASAELGQTSVALKTFQAFLRDAPSDPNAPTARQLAGRLEMEAAARPVATFPAAIGPAPSRAEPPVASSSAAAVAVSAPTLPLPDWEPAGVDQEKPPIADGVTCPSAQVIREAGERVSELVDSVNRIEATEKVTHEELSTMGHPVFTEKREFDYLISITDSTSGILNVSEDRQGEGSSQFLGHVSMFGLADLPLIFHPSLRRDFQMTCEGLGRWQGRATWLVYFRQRPDRPEQVRSYQLLDGSSYTVGLKGRAWIAADTYQIVRIEAELMKALPQIGLGSEEDVIEYGPVPFDTKKTVLWLPSSADIYYFYQHRPYHRHHAFTGYRLFSVSTTQKIGQPNRGEEKNDRH